MELWLNDKFRLVMLLGVCTLLASVEAVLPLFRYRKGRFRRALPNVALTAILVLTNFALTSLSAFLAETMSRNRIGLLAKLQSHHWILAFLGVAGLDLCAYFAHVFLHKIPLGWKFHRVHHSEMEVDVTTAFRQHPGETFWRTAWQCLGIAVLGLPFWIVAVYLSVSSVNALLEHANVRMNDRFDKVLRLLIVTPNMHKIHHSRVIAESDSNYSNIFSIWDRLARTYTARTNCRELHYGIEDSDKQRQSLVRLLGEPFRSS